MILTLLSAACFTGGLINRLVDSRLTGLVGKRAVPRHNHVIVIGLGQVGLRLCMLLRECGVLVVAVDADEDAETVGLARRLQIPVVIGRAANPELLRRLSLGHGASVRGGHERGPGQHRVGDDRALTQPRSARRAASRRRRRARRRRARWRGSATSSTCTGSARPTSRAWRSAPRRTRWRCATAARSCCCRAASARRRRWRSLDESFAY